MYIMLLCRLFDENGWIKGQVKLLHSTRKIICSTHERVNTNIRIFIANSSCIYLLTSMRVFVLVVVLSVIRRFLLVLIYFLTFHEASVEKLQDISHGSQILIQSFLLTLILFLTFKPASVLEYIRGQRCSLHHSQCNNSISPTWLLGLIWDENIE